MTLFSIGGFCTLCAIGLISQIVYQILYYTYFHPLSKVPGTLLSSTTRLWGAWHNFMGDEIATYQKLHAKYGPVIRISPTMVMVTDATKLPIIYHRYADKTGYYVSAGLGLTPSIFTMHEAATHAHFRKITATSYSFTNIKRMEPLMDEQIERWLAKLDAKFGNGKTMFDFAPWAVYMAYDVISAMGFGAPIGFVEQERDVGGLIKGFHDGSVMLGILNRLYPLMTFMKQVLPKQLLLLNRNHEWGIGSLLAFSDILIAQKQHDMKAGTVGDRVDILQTLLEYVDEDGKHLEIDYVKSEVILVLAAGADTTGSVFQALMVQLLSNSKMYENVLMEISEADKAGRLSKMVKYDEVMACCPYYIACVRETLRLYAPALTLMPRVVPEGGLEIHGHFIPAGMEITCHPGVNNVDVNVFGPDAHQFRPERWLEEEKAKELQKLVATWGYGARVCLGKDIAMMELFKAPLQFLRTFSPRAANREAPAKRVFKGVVAYYTSFLMTIHRKVSSRPTK